MSIPPRLWPAVPLLLLATAPAWCDPPVRTDCHGDPLPPGAVARFGTIRWRTGDNCVLLAFAPDGKTLVSADRSNGVFVWDRATGKRLRQLGPFPGDLRCAAVSRDGRLVAMAGGLSRHAGGNLYTIADLSSGKQLQRFVEREGPGIGGVVSAIAFSPDSSKLASRHFGAAAVKLWDLRTGRRLRQLGELFAPELWEGKINTAPHTLAFTPDGKFLVAAGEYEDACTWNLATGKARPYRKPLPKVNGSLTPADIEVLALAAEGRLAWFGDSALRVGDVSWKGKPLVQFKDRASMWEGRLAFSPDGRLLAATLANGALLVWDLAANRKVLHLSDAGRGQASALAVAPDGRTVAAAVGPAIRLWDISSGREVTPEAGHRESVTAAALSPDGKTLVTCGGDGTFRLWDAPSGRQRHVHPVPRQRAFPREIAFSPAGGTFALTDWERLYLFDAGTGKLRRRLPVPLHAAEDASAVAGSLAPRPLLAMPQFLGSLARQVAPCEYVENVIGFSPDGQRLISAHRSGLALHDPGFLCVWDPATGQQLRCSPIPFWYLRAGSHGGRRFMWISRDDPEPAFRLRDADCDKDLSRFRLDSGSMWNLVFLADGQSLAIPISPDLDSGQGETIPLIHLIEVHSGQTRRRFLGPVEHISTLAVSPDGRLLASAADGRVRLWDVGLGKEVGCLKGQPAGVTALCFSADGKRLVSAGKDTTAILWDVAALIPPRNQAAAAPLSPQRLEQLWSDLATADASLAFDATLLLTADPRGTVPFLSKRLRPARALDAEQLKRWIAGLGSAVFATREQCSRELAALGERVEPALTRALRTPQSLEQRRRIEQLLQRLERQAVGANQLRELRAVEVLQGIGNAEALRLLEKLATGVPDIRLTREATAAVERLRGRQLFSRADRSP